MTLLQTTRTPYLFDKDLSVHVVYAEVTHFAANMSLRGRSEEEVQTFTRRLSWIADRDLNWCDVDQLISYAADLRTVTTDHARGALLIELFWEITTVLGTVRTRWEES